MRLTNDMRDAFVAAVLEDLPEVDYDSEIRTLVMNDFVHQLPPKVRTIWDTPALQGYILTIHYGVWHGELPSDRVYFSAIVPAARGYDLKLTPQTQDQVDALLDLWHAQDRTKRELRIKLEASVKFITTDKALIASFPEFEKYVPKPPEQTPNLPAHANLIADLMKDGWPKDRVAA